MAVDTSTFARLLLSGAQQGIGLGQSIDQQRFQQQQFDANQQQQAFGNMMALQGLDMRRQQLAWEAEDRTKQWQAENERDAANQAVLKAMTTADDATFQSAIPSLLPVLNKASPDLQRGLLNKQAYLQQYQKEAAMLESLRSQGGKLTAEQADKYRERGHMITRDMLAKTAREEQDAKDRINIDAMATNAVIQGLVTEREAQYLKSYATPQALNWDLTARRVIKQQQEKQLADQQAAIQKQQQQQAAYSNARSAAVKAGANPTEVDARIAADQAGLSLGENAFGSNESASAVRAALNQRISAAKTAWEMAQKDLEPFAAAVGADPLTGEPKEPGVTGSGTLDYFTFGLGNLQDENDKKLIATYQQKKKVADDARRNYEALNQQALSGGAIGGDLTQQKRARALELKNQGVPLEQARSILLQEFGE